MKKYFPKLVALPKDSAIQMMPKISPRKCVFLSLKEKQIIHACGLKDGLQTIYEGIMVTRGHAAMLLDSKSENLKNIAKTIMDLNLMMDAIHETSEMALSILENSLDMKI